MTFLPETKNKVFYLVSMIVCTLISWLFASLVEGEWIDPFEGYKKQKEQQKIDARWKRAEAAYQALKQKEWEEWKLEKERRRLQGVETKKRQAEKAAIKAAKRAAHRERTLANKKRKEQARMEHSLRKWGVPYLASK